MVSQRVIGRLSLYRRILANLQEDGQQFVFSHELAVLAGCTPAQVRRDLMVLKTEGTPIRGYDIERLLGALDEVLVGTEVRKVVLVGIGNLGRAVLSYFQDRQSNLVVAGAFDRDPAVTGRVISGCRCYPMEDIKQVIDEENIRVAMLAVPAGSAQAAAKELVEMGIEGFLNFAPTPLNLGRNVYVEHVDIMTSLERVIYFTQNKGSKGSKK